MDPFYDNSSMVFHAPVQRRHNASRGLGLTEPIPGGITFIRGTAAFPAERQVTPLPPLPALFGSRSHLRPHAQDPPYLESWTQRPEQRPSLDTILSSVRRSSDETRRLSPSVEDSEYLDNRYNQVQPWRGRLNSESSASNMSPMSHASSSSTPPAGDLPAPQARPRLPRSKDAPSSAKAPAAADKKKRKARICTTEGCTKYVVDHGLCIRHGGGKRCYIEGCDCRAQNRGLCWKHGGFTICKVDGCTKRAKSRGICWSHGGGTRCKRDDCTKIAVSNGLCWAHGGGKRCVFASCRKPASERTNNFCNEHFAWDDDRGLEEEL